MSYTTKRLFCFLMLALMLIGSIARGDGKFFYMEKIPVGIPYQRAILMFEDGKETLLLQSQYKTVGAGDVNSIAWVVPVPAVPELGSMDAKEARIMFFFLSIRSRPNVFPIVRIAIAIGIIVIISLVISKILKWFLPKLIKTGMKSWAISGFRIAIWSILGLVLLTFMIPTLGITKVDVLKAETVGIYDVKVIKGDDASAVTQWLMDNGFGFEEKDSKVFDQYVKKGWCFVTAKVSKHIDANSEGATSKGLAAPLILRFDSKEAIYPMALTGTMDENTEVLLYIFSDHKMECGDRLKLAFFGEASRPFGKGAFPEFFRDVKTKSWQLCKFKGTLEPDQMREDIVFKKAKDDEPYKEIRWY